jgi:hypothetical protein
MVSASDINDAERGIPEREPFPISLALPMQHSESTSTSSSDANIHHPWTSPLPLAPIPTEKRELSPQIDIKRKKGLPRLSTVAVAIAAPTNKKPPPKKQISRWIRFKLWFNTYRSVNFFIKALCLIKPIPVGNSSQSL